MGGPAAYTLDVAGHSYLMGTGTAFRTGGMAQVLQSLLGVDNSQMRNRARSGARLTEGGASSPNPGNTNGSYATVMQQVLRPARSAPYTSYGGVVVLCWGVNDLRLAEEQDPDAFAQVRLSFENALRAVISRYASAVVFEQNDGSVVQTSGTWTTVSTVDRNSGSGYIESTSNPAVLTITVPSDFEGGTVALQFIGGPAGASATGDSADVAVDGGTAVTVSTDRIGPTSSLYSPVCYRITGLSAGTHTITVSRKNTNSQPLRFDCWQIEGDPQQPVVVCTVPRIPESPAWDISDDEVFRLNGVIADVVYEFYQGVASGVVLCDLEAALARKSSLFAPPVAGVPDVHPNQRGHSRCGQAMYNTIVAAAWQPAQLASIEWAGPSPEFAWAGSPGTLADQAISVGTANQGIWQRVSGSGPCNAICVQIVANPNPTTDEICLAIYADDPNYGGTWSGLDSRPGALKATTGAVTFAAGSGTGFKRVPLLNTGIPNAVWVNDGDWLFISAETTAVTFATNSTAPVLSGVFPSIGSGLILHAANAHPAPNLPPAISYRYGSAIALACDLI